MIIKLLFLLAILLGWSAMAHAQTACPAGMTPYGDGVCGYDYSNQPQQQPNPPPPPPPRWIGAYGAIVTDASKGILSTVQNRTTREDAIQAALTDCHSKGGIACKLQIVYENECGVVIQGTEGFNVNSAGRLDQAIRQGMDECNASDKDCRVVYQGCSLPLRIQ